MKEFENWDKKNKLNYAAGPNHREVNVKNERRKGWRASLKWLETVATAIEIDEDADGFDIGDLHKVITKELET